MTEETGYSRLIGHEDAVEKLVSAVKNNRVSHAWIFQGEPGSGRKMCAQLFAMALQCETQSGSPCMQCPSCRKALHGNHPDILTVTPEKGGTLSVEDIRRQLAADVSVRPYESRYKIYIVPEADRMTVQAQNAMLKTLEEPPAYCVILLLAEGTDAFLPTISSRCISLTLRPVRTGLVRRYLEEQYGLDRERAGLFAAFARGSIGRAKALAEDEDYTDRMQTCIEYLKHSRQADGAEQLAFVRKLAQDSAGIGFALELFSMWFRDVALMKAAEDAEQLIFAGEEQAIRTRAAKSSFEGLGRIFRALDSVQKRLKANVNTELTLQVLLETVREN